MSTTSRSAALVLGLFLLLGLGALGALLGHAALRFKAMERTVTVKGLSEREVPADVVLWPIQFTAADNDLVQLYEKLESQASEIRAFLLEQAIPAQEITVSPPAIVDRLAQPYGGNAQVPFRYSAVQTVSVYSTGIDTVRDAISSLAELGRSGIVFKGAEYGNQTQYLFRRLNEIKPAMVEEATRNARSVAEKFAADSESRLGKIKRAHQGQFSISSRDIQTPHMKKVRVVSTVEYYLSD
jgi:hypothetical protein